MLYRVLYDNLFVHTNPEHAHNAGIEAISVAGKTAASRAALRATFGKRPSGLDRPELVTRAHQRVETAFGRPVPGLLGLAAGMDKDAVAILGLDALGFGFVEIGTVTALPQPGNERPRLWRHTDTRALRNRMGFNNEGASAIADRLRKLRSRPAGREVVVGVNIGKSKVTPLDEAADDYRTSTRLLSRYADYLVVNVSSPNTHGLRDLQETESLEPILQAVQEEALASTGHEVPLFVKIAPDLSDDGVSDVARLAQRLGLTGVAATNTTIQHDFGLGGLSGPPLKARALDVIRIVRDELGENGLIMGSGGITTVEDAREFMTAGADLLTAFTAFVYEGPAWPGRINRQLESPSQA